jgi:hypothetical protein
MNGTDGSTGESASQRFLNRRAALPTLERSKVLYLFDSGPIFFDSELRSVPQVLRLIP